MEQETIGCYRLFIKDLLYQLKGTKFIYIYIYFYFKVAYNYLFLLQVDEVV